MFLTEVLGRENVGAQSPWGKSFRAVALNVFSVLSVNSVEYTHTLCECLF